MDWTFIASLAGAVAAILAAVYGGLTYHHQRKRNELEDTRYFNSQNPSITCINRTTVTGPGNPGWHKMRFENEGQTFKVEKIYSVDGKTKAKIEPTNLPIKKGDQFDITITPGLPEGQHAKVILHVRTTDNACYYTTIISRYKSEEISEFLVG